MRKAKETIARAKSHKARKYVRKLFLRMKSNWQIAPKMMMRNTVSVEKMIWNQNHELQNTES